MNNTNLISTMRWVCIIYAMSLFAQEITFAEEPGLVEFEIEAQELGDALTEFGVQSGTEVYFVSADVVGVQAPRIEGKYSATDVIQQLLGSSGVEYFIDGNGTLLVGTAYTALTTSDERGASDSKNLTPTPILMAQNQMSQTTSTEINRRTDDGGTSIVTGKVTDARTGANLKGAKVTIEETGQWTSTNDLGEFRFINVPIGSATLTVSYLGYAGQSTGIAVYGDGTSQDFALRGGSEIEEIVVFGQRSARALALNQERTADNVSTVVSSDLLGNFDAATISEALRRVPGVAFLQTGTGDRGTNIVIRGLEPNFNLVRLNGIPLPSAVFGGTGRTADLSNILADSVSKITISKTLLPSQESAGTGGLVDIEMKSPLDRPRRYADFGVERRWQDDDFGEDWLLTGSLAGTFGRDENFGLSISAQYNEDQDAGASFTVSGDSGLYLPLEVDGSPSITSLDDIDPRLQFPFSGGAPGFFPDSAELSQRETSVEVLSVSAAAEMQLSDHTNLQLDMFATSSESRSELQNLTQSASSSYRLLPVNALGGEERGILNYNGRFLGSQSFQFGGFEQDTTTMSFRGVTEVNKWTVHYQVGYSEGNFDSRGSRTLSFRNRSDELQGTVDPNLLFPSTVFDEQEQRIVNVFGNRAGLDTLPILGLTDAAFALLNDMDSYRLTLGSQSTTRAENSRLPAEFRIRRNSGTQLIDYLEVGVHFERNENTSFALPRLTYNVFPDPVTNLTPSASELGVDFGPSRFFSVVASAQPYQLIDVNSARALFDRLDSVAETNPLIERAVFDRGPLSRSESNVEEEVAPYFQGKFKFGRLEVIGGVRASSLEVKSTFLNSPSVFDDGFVPRLDVQDRNTVLLQATERDTTWLPRLLANYKFSENIIARLGYFQTIARPSVGDLTATQSVTVFEAPFFGPSNDQPSMQIFRGNPNLEPAITDNYDFSFEWYRSNSSALKIGIFYKSISNLLEQTEISDADEIGDLQLPDDPYFNNLPPDIFVQVFQATNNPKDAKIWGVEVAVEQQFTELPGAFAGLGMFANYTYTESEKQETLIWRGAPVFDDDGNVVGREPRDVVFDDVPFFASPEHSGTFAVTYNQNGVDASLAYTWQDRYMDRFRGHGLSSFREEVDSLDFRVEYRFDQWAPSLRMYVQGSDLLRGAKDAERQLTLGGANGTPKHYILANFDGGRSFGVGIRGSF